MVKRTIIYASLTAIILSVLIIECINNKKPKHPYSSLNTTELIQRFGYPAEVHEVFTEDGYIITLHRITNQNNKIPILFMHGFMQSAIDFVHLGPGKALTLLLADQGYDIWLGNARGSTWSRKHTKLDPDKDKEFWDFSLHEIGVYDVSAFIDHILNTTNQRALQYVGFSQGAIVFFILMSEKPQYADKVNLMTALAPAVFLNNPSSPALRAFVFFRKTIATLLNIFNIREFLSHDGIIAVFTKQICNENSIFVNLCLHQFFLMHGYNFESANKTMLSLIYSNTPAGVSSKQMLHIMQLMDSGEFRQYDLGPSDNVVKYGQKIPPSYDLSKVTTPVALYYTSNDWTVNIENIKKIVNVLPNVIKSEQVLSEKFNHDDFVHSDTARDLIYPDIIEEIIIH